MSDAQEVLGGAQEPAQGDQLNFADVDAAMLAAGLLDPLQSEGAEMTATSGGDCGGGQREGGPPTGLHRLRTGSGESIFAPLAGGQPAAAQTPRPDSQQQEEQQQQQQLGSAVAGFGGGATAEQQLPPLPGGGAFSGGYGQNAMESAALLAEVQQQLVVQVNAYIYTL